MGKLTVTQEINCNLETFWNYWFDKGISEKAYLEDVGYIDYTILEQVETDESISRKVVMHPNMSSMLGPLVKLLGSKFSYTEESRFNKTTGALNWKRIPSALMDKLRVEGIVHAEVIDDTRIRCTTEVTLEAKVFGVGGLLESSLEKQMSEEFGKYAAYLNKLS